MRGVGGARELHFPECSAGGPVAGLHLPVRPAFAQWPDSISPCTPRAGTQFPRVPRAGPAAVAPASTVPGLSGLFAAPWAASWSGRLGGCPSSGAMDSPEVTFTLAYLVFAVCFVFTPTEFQSAGLTVQNLLSGWLGSEDAAFVSYHLRRTAATLLCHSLLPLGEAPDPPG